MKKLKPFIFLSLIAAAAFHAPCLLAENSKGNSPMSSSKGVTTIVTTDLCNVKGFAGTVPLKITVKKGKITEIVPLPNKETPSYFEKVISVVLPKWIGVPVNKVVGTKVDAATGATFSSKAFNENVKAAAQYLLSEGKGK